MKQLKTAIIWTLSVILLIIILYYFGKPKPIKDYEMELTWIHCSVTFTNIEYYDGAKFEDILGGTNFQVVDFSNQTLEFYIKLCDNEVFDNAYLYYEGRHYYIIDNMIQLNTIIQTHYGNRYDNIIIGKSNNMVRTVVMQGNKSNNYNSFITVYSGKLNFWYRTNFAEIDIIDKHYRGKLFTNRFDNW